MPMPIPITLTALIPGEETTQNLWSSIEHITASNIFSAVLSIVISLVLIKILTRVLERALGRSKLDPPLQTLLRTVLKGALWSVAAIIVLGCLGIEVTSLVAVLSVVGLAFSLALQNFLSNVAGGMQLLASHPFAVGDFVDAGGCSGTVAEIGMFYTKLTTPDNKLVQLPQQHHCVRQHHQLLRPAHPPGGAHRLRLLRRAHGAGAGPALPHGGGPPSGAGRPGARGPRGQLWRQRHRLRPAGVVRQYRLLDGVLRPDGRL